MNAVIPVVEVYMLVSNDPSRKHDPLPADKPNFDPDSPDLKDPQIDPPQPVKTPGDKQPQGDYPPYDESE